MYANLIIQDTQFKNNYAQERTRGIFCAFANIFIDSSEFYNTLQSQWEAQLLAEQTTGTFIFMIFDVNTKIKGTQFKNGMSSQGGALYIAGESVVDIQQSLFQNNKARFKGGAIFSEGFKSIYVGNQTIFKDNFAIDQGDDIYLTGSLNLISIDNVKVTNIDAKNSIFIEQAKLSSNQLQIKNIYRKRDSERGSGIYCQYCNGLQIINSSFLDLRSKYGGAIYIIEQDIAKSLSYDENSFKFQIENSYFSNCSAEQGGALMLDNIESIIIKNTQFIGNQAKSITQYQSHSVDPATGGAIYYSCNEEILNCRLKFEGINNFKLNYAQVKGGAIYWSSLEPEYNDINLNFINNTGFLYGDNFACYAQNLVSLTAKQSGGSVPILFIALIDKYGQILGSDSTKGSSDFQVEGGIAVIQDVIIAGNPGSTYNIKFSTDGIDVNKISNKQAIKKLNQQDLDFNLSIDLRECFEGDKNEIARLL
ncbi:UNKNOWN [Stylonychia lemnae]|uniref:Right handed beta helix domain-containing protein n=1 Tax=Stylonychia lemnae TaxID=5949 RepID=A0A078A7C2_STYLE|nr:UNKNOWN [Stylonychia lemnae]|eukprot:CDW77437.1 UNKNOWN [Stylonychia lemnae]